MKVFGWNIEMKVKGCHRCGKSMAGRPLKKFIVCKKCDEEVENYLKRDNELSLDKTYSRHNVILK